MVFAIDWSGSMDDVLGFIEKRVVEQSNRISAITAAVCHQNIELRTACSQLQTSCMLLTLLCICILFPEKKLIYSYSQFLIHCFSFGAFILLVD